VEVLKTIKRHKKGIDTATLIKITGFADSTVRNVVYRAAKEGTIKRVRRGVYVVA
jgi:predicted transcriptional regulator of viral defense system